MPADTRLIDLSHTIEDGMITYPGLPAPRIGTHLSREASEAIYPPGNSFHIGLIEICTNTGTYLDVPFHRFADGHDLAGLVLERVAGIPAVCLDARRVRSVDVPPADLGKLIDCTDSTERPVHTTLLAAGIPIVEHLTNLAALPSGGFTFTAAPPKIAGAGTFTVRAFASVP